MTFIPAAADNLAESSILPSGKTKTRFSVHHKPLSQPLLAFNVDPDFCHVLDGLIVVDLTKTDRRLLARYMGEQNLAGFLSHHGIIGADSATAMDAFDPA